MKHTLAIDTQETKYINKRLRQAFREKLRFFLCRVFPIKKNLVSVCTFEGKGGFGCNPKYIVMELHKQDPSVEFVWLVNPDVYDKKQFPDYIRKVPNTPWSRAYWLTRSKVWIDNYRKPLGTCKRRGQYYLNTWHANEGFKAIGLLRGKEFSPIAYLVSKNDSDMIDAVSTDSIYLEKMYHKGLLYDREFIRTGQCRCDVLYGDRSAYKEKFRKEHNIPETAKIVMFAPTFREKDINGKRTVFSELWTLDFERLISNLKKRFQGEWCLCVRLHPQLADKFTAADFMQEFGLTVIDASKDDDMYELLAGMDVLVTDYSSVAFDASLCRMPVFLYADDIKEYAGDRGGLLWNLGDKGNVRTNDSLTPGFHAVLPYPIAEDNEELENDILTFSEEIYEKRLRDMEYELGISFDGRASEKTAQWIMNCMQK